MRRIYWDTMLLIYLLDRHPVYSRRVERLLDQSFERGDRLFISYAGLGEVLAGAAKSPDLTKAATIRATVDEMGFSYLPFDQHAVEPFSHLRSVHRVKTLDAMHLACAAATGIDLFLTGDQALWKLHVPGIHFIADFQTTLIQP